MTTARLPFRPSVDALVREIYGSLLDDSSFLPCVRSLGGAFGSHISALHVEESVPRRASLEVTGEMECPEFLAMSADYAARWAGQNLWVERGMAALRERGYGTGEEGVSDAELLSSDYYRYFLKPAEIRHGMGIMVHADPSRVALVSLNRGEGAGRFTEEEMAAVAQLRPHLVNAYAIWRRLVAVTDQATSLQASFDRLPLGMLVFNALGTVIESNEEASRLLAESRGIGLNGGGCLRLADPVSQAKYQGALQRLLADNPGQLAEAIVIGRCDQQDGRALVLHLCTFPSRAAPALLGCGRIIGFLCDLDRHAHNGFAARLLRTALDLTSMEAAVVLSLRDNHDPMHVALELGLAVSTVRSHLKHVFRKTGTTRQAELLRLTERLLSAAPG